MGTLFSPSNCDYTFGLSILLNTQSIIEIFAPFYTAIGSESNGQTCSVYGLPPDVADKTKWRGLQIDCVFMTVLNDIEKILQKGGRADLIEIMDTSNALLSLVCEINFKEWHGSPLDTKAMLKSILKFIESGSQNTRPELKDEIKSFYRATSPRMRLPRKILNRIGLFYKIYNLKWKIKHLLLGSEFPEKNFDYSNHPIPLEQKIQG
jgi:hypothetical protein